jgi:hypothetical protein
VSLRRAKKRVWARTKADFTVLVSTIIVCLFNVGLILLSATFAKAVALPSRHRLLLSRKSGF